MPKIIQFLHPGMEATPERGSTMIPWNCSNEHKRKFMVSRGKYVSEKIEKEDCLTFWGECESHSLVERLPIMGGAFPNSNRFLITKG
jgi:hypothetical protein